MVGLSLPMKEVSPQVNESEAAGLGKQDQYTNFRTLLSVLLDKCSSSTD